MRLGSVTLLAGSLSVISGIVGVLALGGAWVFAMQGAKGGTQGWATGMLLIAGWGPLYVAIAVWLVASRRWPLVRWVAAALPAALIVYSAWAMMAAPSPVWLFTAAYGAGAGSFLVSPEVSSWTRRGRR